MQLARAILATPIGDMLALSSDEGLCALEFTGPRKRLTRLERRLAKWFPPHTLDDRDSRTIRRTRTWLRAYFEGTSADLGDIPLDMRGAPFEKQVWKELLRIPPGETTSYGAIAKRLSSA